MINSEKTFWKSIKISLKRENIIFQRFEDMLSEGIPDLCVFVNGETVWIELKYKKLPVRKSTKIKVGLRPAQRVWLHKANNSNIKSYIMTMLDNGVVMLHSSCYASILYDGLDMEKLNEVACVASSINDCIKYIKGKGK